MLLAMAYPARTSFICGILATASAHAAETPVAPRDPLSFSFGGGTVKLGLQAGAQYVVESNSFWNLADAFALAENFDSDMAWGEFYARPGLTAEFPLGDAKLRAGVSVIGSQSAGRDVFDQRDQGAIVLEDAYVGISAGKADGLRIDASVGAQPYRIGSGMLIADGAVDGFERGALIFGPRGAWAMTGTARLAFGKASLEGFHLDPRELPSGDTRTIINGLKAEVKLADDRFVGIAYGHVPRSEAPYVQAAPGGIGAPVIIANGRDGLSFVNFYAKLSPLPQAVPGLWVAVDYAWQRNSRINMKATGGRFEIGHVFQKTKWRPTLSYAYQRFSGDDPATTRLERFDPLFYDGSPPGWATGSNGSFVFINSNIRGHRVVLATYPSARDIVTLRYTAVLVDKLGSPIQFGQATRPILGPGAPGIVAGVTERRLSDDILVEYTHVLSANIFLTGGIAHSNPAAGIRQLAPSAVKPWTGGFANIVMRY